MSIKRVGRVWHVTKKGVTLATFKSFKEAARWMVQQTDTGQLAA
jgi:hypothetical protein